MHQYSIFGFLRSCADRVHSTFHAAGGRKNAANLKRGSARFPPAAHKKAPVRNFPFHTPARVKAGTFFVRPSPCTRTKERGIIYLPKRGESRCVWRAVLRMQGAGCLQHFVPALHFLLCSAITSISLLSIKFNLFYKEVFWGIFSYRPAKSVNFLPQGPRRDEIPPSLGISAS